MTLRIDQIVVPSDGSSEAEAAFAAIRPLIGAFRPEVAVVHVHEGPTEPVAPPDLLTKSLASLKASGMNVVLEMRRGVPVDEILQVARARKADLVAISTHGRTGLRRILMGSVAEDLLRRSELPVLVSRPGQPVREWRRIMVALDGSPRSEQILPDAAMLAKATKSAIDLVRVSFAPVTASGLGEVPMYMPTEDVAPYLKQMVSRAAELGVEARPVALEGLAATRMVDHAVRADVGLICMTTHGRTGMPRLLMGSIAEELLRRAPCPVLVRRSVPVAASQATKA